MTKLPTIRQLEPFREVQECYEIVHLVRAKFPYLKIDSGFFVRSDGLAGDHAWLVAPDGTIIDTTHGQFDDNVPILIAKPHTDIYKRFYSWELHHNPHCLHKLLKVWYPCEVNGCDYKGDERLIIKRKEIK